MGIDQMVLNVLSKQKLKLQVCLRHFAFVEYGYTLQITEKSHVYSFGIVLFEVVTGRRAVEPSTSHGVYIVKWVQMMKRSYQPTLEFLDPRLRGMPDLFIQEME